MDFTQTIKREHERMSEIIERLADSSDTALKTRERLSHQLATMLDEHARKEEAAFYPALRAHRDAHEGIDDFLVGARAAHAQMARLSLELDSMAKDAEGLLPKVNELKPLAQRHMREEERLLAPLAKALGEEELKRLDEAMAGRGEEAAEQVAQSAGSAVARGAEIATVGARRLAQAATDEAEHRNRAVLAAAEIYGETAQLTAEDMQAIATCSGIAAGGLGEMRHAWMEWLSRSLRAGARASEQLLRCTTIEQLADIQRNFLKESLDNLLEGSAQMLRISSRITEDAARPIEDRVSHLRRASERPSRARRSA